MENSKIVRSLFEALDSKNLKNADNYLSNEFTYSGAMPAPINKKEWTDTHQALFKAMPDLKFNLHDVKEEGDRVSAKIRMEGTHTGTLNIPSMKVTNVLPTNKKVRLPEENLNFSLKENKILNCDVQKIADGGVQGILKQIGVKVSELAY